MPRSPTILERAYELARSGAYRNHVPIVAQLKREGFEQVDAHFNGAAIKRQLGGLCSQAMKSLTPGAQG